MNSFWFHETPFLKYDWSLFALGAYVHVSFEERWRTHDVHDVRWTWKAKCRAGRRPQNQNLTDPSSCSRYPTHKRRVALMFLPFLFLFSLLGPLRRVFTSKWEARVSRKLFRHCHPLRLHFSYFSVVAAQYFGLGDFVCLARGAKTTKK